MTPVPLPIGSSSLPPLGGRLFLAYRLIWWALLALAVAVAARSWFEAATPLAIWSLRLVKSAVLIAVSAVLFRRRGRDPVAAMLALCFLLWTVSSSVDFAGATGLPALLDRCRFLLFALALLIFPDGEWFPRWTRQVAVAIVFVFLIGIAEALGILQSSVYLPLAIGCVLMAIAALIASYRQRANTMQRQQLKWVALGLVAGVSLILFARAGAAVTAQLEMPLAATVLLEGLFQVGIVVVALGFLTSLLRYRLYDAETAISRSAAYAGLTLALVAVFAASESIIQTIGQRYFGSGIGDLSGGIAAAIAAVLLTPLHGRISSWAEMHFQRDLNGLKSELPDLLAMLSGGSSVARLGSAVLPRIQEAIHATRIALLIDSKPVAFRGIAKPSVHHWLNRWKAPALAGLFDQADDRDYPIRMALRCPYGAIRGWLLLGPRPDGSLYGTDDFNALESIAMPLRRTIFSVAEREKERQAAKAGLDQLVAKISKLEAALAENGDGRRFGPQGTFRTAT
jgi:hypothetical protein